MQNLTTVIEFQVINKYIAQHQTMNVKDIVWLDQGIIDSWAKEPKLAKLLRELKLSPMSYNKKWQNLACFGCFAAV